MKTLTLEETIQWMERCIFEGADLNEDFWNNYTDALHYLETWKLIVESERKAHKADVPANPPLTWDELCRIDMIGEPVWNLATRRWMLLIDSANDNTLIELVNHAGGREHWIEHDLRLAPLYRKPVVK